MPSGRRRWSTLRPIRRASAPGAESAGVLPASHLARGRSGRGTARARPSTDRRPMGHVRIWSVRSGGYRGPSGSGPSGHDHRTGRAGRSSARRSSGTPPNRRCLAGAGLASAVGLVAGTDNDTTNLSMLATARRLNPNLFLAARQNLPTSAAPPRRCGWMPSWFRPRWLRTRCTPSSARRCCGASSRTCLRGQPVGGRSHPAAPGQLRSRAPALWKVKLDRDQAPALGGWLGEGKVVLGT